jgi:hypothetical protein
MAILQMNVYLMRYDRVFPQLRCSICKTENEMAENPQKLTPKPVCEREEVTVL